MGFFKNMRKGAKPVEKSAAVVNVECVHVALAPRWNSAADMGKADKISGYKCDACGKELTPDEEADLRASQTERLKAELNLDSARDA